MPWAPSTQQPRSPRRLCRAAEAKRAPVLIQISAERLKYAGVGFLPMLVSKAAQIATVPVAIHLDRLGFQDRYLLSFAPGSRRSCGNASEAAYSENVAEVHKVVEVCHLRGRARRSGDRAGALAVPSTLW